LYIKKKRQSFVKKKKDAFNEIIKVIASKP
jgi:hypothetical protein